MNKLSLAIVLLSFSMLAHAYQVNGFVNDYANVIPDNYAQLIEGELQQLYDNDTVQFAVVTIPSLDGENLEDLSFRLADGTLGNTEKNNGLLLLIAVQDRKWRFEVGRGIEPVLNDAKIGRIGREQIAPNFRNGDYGEGIYQAVLAVKGEFGDSSVPSVNPLGTLTDFWQRNRIIVVVALLIFALIIVSVVYGVGKALSGKRNSKGEDKDGYLVAAAVLSMLSNGRRGGGSGGFGGGGFGGFGGGGFGGGGASGRW